MKNSSIPLIPYNKQRVSIELKVVPTNENQLGNHHTSMIYGTEFISTNSVFSIKRKNKSQELTAFQNIKKSDIFSIVYLFIGKMITNSSYIKSISKDMQFINDQSNISITKISGRIYSQNGSFTNSSSSKSTIRSNADCKNQIGQKLLKVPQNNQSGSRIIQFDSQEKGSQFEESRQQIGPIQILQKKELKDKKPKISIMFSLKDGSANNFSSASSSWFSETTSLNFSSIKVPCMILTPDLVSRIYQDPQPFLINLSLCLLVKFLFYSKIQINIQNTCWMLSIGTIIAYKIYYDEPVEGLIESFSDILEIPSKDIKDLERYFLDQIQFQAVITNSQYHTMLSKIINS